MEETEARKERANNESPEPLENQGNPKNPDDSRQSPERAAEEPGMRLIRVKNLHCAACALDLQDEIEKIEGVRAVSVDFITQSIRVDVADDGVLRKVIRKANRFDNVKVLDAQELLPPDDGKKREIVRLGLAAAFFVAGIVLQFTWSQNGPVGWAFMLVVYGISYLAAGVPVLISTGKNLVKGKIFDENFLMTVASVGAIALGEYGEAAAVMLLYQTGEFLQSVAVGASRRSVSALMDLRSERATLLRDGRQIQTEPKTLHAGDLVLVKAGEKIPADGVVAEGETFLDTKSLTGESRPRLVRSGDEVLSGCINAGGNIQVKIVREYRDSAVAKILDMLENSSATKAPPEKFITKFAKYYTPAVCALALLLAVLPPIFIGLSSGEYPWTEWITRALTLLVVSCPCALVISVPLTYFGGVGCAARHGILVKGATFLDRAAQAKVAAFDKTGTLTEGNFRIVSVRGGEQTLRLAAAAERGSSHPLAKLFENVETPYVAEEVHELAGRGVVCRIEGERVLVGNAELLRENGIYCGRDGRTDETAKGEKSFASDAGFCVAKGGELIGYIEIGDALKADASSALSALKELGVEKCVMLTGDSPEHAARVAEQLQAMDEVYAGLLPDEKLGKAEELKKTGVLLYAGDGINDAPVMMAADCSFSMGKIGSAAAIEASDFVVLSDRLSAIPTAVAVAKKTRRIVFENIIFSVVAKLIFMGIGAAGVLPLALAVFADVGIMLLAVLNAMRMRLPLKSPRGSFSDGGKSVSGSDTDQ